MNEITTIVSDPGIDDMIALLLFSKLAMDDIDHVLVSSFGNVPSEFTSKNAREFIAFVEPEWKYFQGSNQPLRPLEHPWPTYFHGPDGVWHVHPVVDTQQVEQLQSLPTNGSVLSLGPMTDVFHLWNIQKPRELMIMGGAFNVPGNETPYAETNIAFDPDAAAEVFLRCEETTVRVVPLDVTKKVFWTKEKVLTIPENNKKKQWAKRLLLTWFEQYGDEHKANFDLHDPLAVYAMFFPEKLHWVTIGVEVITTGERRGQTVVNANNPECNVALGVDQPMKIADHLFELLFE